MHLIRKAISSVFLITALAILSPASCHGQAALLMEEPYGFFGMLNPTGHNAIYLARVCAQTPVQLRRCQPGELGSVIARYQGIDGYDWIAIPLIPYLYSVEDTSDVPARVDRTQVARLRDRYREQHLQSLGNRIPSGGFTHGGWTQLLGVAYERRIYAFRFSTTPEQDDALIARMNQGPNRSHFDLLFNNCADFARVVLNAYFPGAFRRSLFPDALMTTPKQTAYKLVQLADKHPAAQLTVFEIPQVPGYRHQSHFNKSIAESITTTGYALPLAIVNPYLAGGLFLDYLAGGRFHLLPAQPHLLEPANLPANLAASNLPGSDAPAPNLPVPFTPVADTPAPNLPQLTAPTAAAENPTSAGAQVPSAAAGDSVQTQTTPLANSGLEEIKAFHE
jgi:hypothetical protein